MQIEEVLAKLLYWGKRIGKIIIGGAILAIEGILNLMEKLHIGEKLSKLTDKIGITLTAKQIEKILCIILCAALIIGLFSMCAPEEKSDGSSSSLFKDDCWRCGGSGNCQECGGDGRKVEWIGDQYMDVRCTSCIGGNCSWCNGSGEE